MASGVTLVRCSRWRPARSAPSSVRARSMSESSNSYVVASSKAVDTSVMVPPQGRSRGRVGEARLDLTTQQLAGVGVGEGASDVDQLGGLEAAQVLPHPVAQLVGGRAVVGGQHHGGDDALTPLWIGHPDDRAVPHG